MGALKVYSVLYHWMWLFLSAIAFVVLAAAFFIYYKPEHHEHVRFELAEVLGIVPLPSETSSQKVVIDMRLQTGEPMRLYSLSSTILGMIDTVCVEVRRFKNSGEPRYRIATLQKCAS